MAASTFKELDESIYDVLNYVRNKPSMYIHQRSIFELSTFVCAYAAGLGHVGFTLRDTKDFHKFHDWVARRLGFSESTSGWANMIREKSESEAAAFQQFFVFLDEFRQESA